MITPAQSRAARVLIGMTAAELATAAGIGSASVKRFESGMAVQAATIDAIVTALQAAGVTFLTDGQRSAGGGLGLRLEGR